MYLGLMFDSSDSEETVLKFAVISMNKFPSIHTYTDTCNCKWIARYSQSNSVSEARK